MAAWQGRGLQLAYYFRKGSSGAHELREGQGQGTETSVAAASAKAGEDKVLLLQLETQLC